MDWQGLSFCVTLFTGGAIAAAYSGIAAQQGWPVGFYFRNNGLMSALGGIVGLGALVLSAIINPWWSLFIVLVAGIICCRVLIAMFKVLSPVVGALMIGIGAVWGVTYWL